MTRPIALPDYAARALAEGRLTQYRVPLKVQPPADAMLDEVQRGMACFEIGLPRPNGDRRYKFVTLHFAPGDVRWVQETWAHDGHSLDDARRAIESDGHTMVCVRHKAGASKFDLATMRWRSPVTMPRWASRWTLTVESVRVERMQDVTEEDARAEGFVGHGPGLCTEDPDMYFGCYSARTARMRDWIARYGPGSWERNDWCAVATFEAERRNVDAP